MNTKPPESQTTVGPRKRRTAIWLVPLLLIFFGGPILVCGGCLFFGMGFLNAPVNAGIEAMSNNPEITAKLGTPIKSGSSKEISNYNNQNGNGGATVRFNASGPNGSANVSGKMKLIAGTWSPDGLTVTFDDGTETTLTNSD